MRATARVYWRLLAAGFRRKSTYRLAALGGLVANLTFGLLKVAILFAAVRAAGGQLHGYTTASMSTYVWLSQGMLGAINMGNAIGGTNWPGVAYDPETHTIYANANNVGITAGSLVTPPDANRVRYTVSSDLVSRRLALLKYAASDGGA